MHRFALLAFAAAACQPGTNAGGATGLPDSDEVQVAPYENTTGGGAGLTSGAGTVAVFEIDGADITAPSGLLTSLLTTVDIAPALLVEVTSYNSTTGAISLLTAWGDPSSTLATPTYKQGPGPTMTCSGTSGSGTYSTSCGSAGWTDMEGTKYAEESATAGATLYQPRLVGDLSTSSGELSLDTATLSGKLDLSTLQDEAGLTTSVLCVLVGGCSTCPGTVRSSCVSFEVADLEGEVDSSLDLVTR